MLEEAKKNMCLSSLGRFTEVEYMCYIRIDIMRFANLTVQPSLPIAKAKNIEVSFSIQEIDFKASRQLLAALDELYATIAHYESENVYNMDET